MKTFRNWLYNEIANIPGFRPKQQPDSIKALLDEIDQVSFAFNEISQMMRDAEPDHLKILEKRKKSLEERFVYLRQIKLHLFRPGDSIKGISGPFRGMEGLVKTAPDNSKFIQVIFAHTPMEMNVPLDSIAKRDTPVQDLDDKPQEPYKPYQPGKDYASQMAYHAETMPDHLPTPKSYKRAKAWLELIPVAMEHHRLSGDDSALELIRHWLEDPKTRPHMEQAIMYRCKKGRAKLRENPDDDLEIHEAQVWYDFFKSEHKSLTDGVIQAAEEWMNVLGVSFRGTNIEIDRDDDDLDDFD